MKKRRRLVIGAVSAVVFIALLLLVNPEVVWRRSEIDVRSGRTRDKWYVVGVLVSETTTNTRFSTWAKEFGLTSSPALWKKYDTYSYSLIGQSPYDEFYFRAGAVSRLHGMVLLDEMGASEEQRRADVATCLQKLQSGDFEGIDAYYEKRNAEIPYPAKDHSKGS